MIALKEVIRVQLSVVYFDQHLDAAHFKCWWKQKDSDQRLLSNENLVMYVQHEQYFMWGFTLGCWKI